MGELLSFCMGAVFGAALALSCVLAMSVATNDGRNR